MNRAARDSDFSSLPIAPPALPDCAKADDEARMMREPKANVRAIACDMSIQSKDQKVLAAGAVGADGPDNPPSFASLAAFFKRGVVS